jgi:HD-like signal output (HDOD) protein/DNA-binding response OmpR family regulator
VDKKPTAMSKRRLKALVVDDEKNVRSLLIAWLFREGFLCNEADDGAKALREISQSRYDLVVADLRMPNRHGYSLCQEILGQDRRPRLVVVTGVDDPRLLRDLQSRGVDHVFQKPVDASEFVSRIRELTQSLDSSVRAGESPTRVTLGANAAEQSVDEDCRLPAVAVLLHDMQHAQELAAQLKCQSLLPFVPESTDALCRLAESRHLELLVLENARFGFLSPRDLVGHLKSSAALTEIILLGDENLSSGAVAGWASAPKLMSHNASDAEVVQVVRGKIAAMNRARGSVSAQARELVRPFATLPNAQQSLLKLAKFLSFSEPDPNPDRLAADVMADAEATAEILRLAKGASAGLRGQIASVTDAINRIGVTRSAALLVSSGIKGAEKPLLRRMSLPLREWYQRRTTLNAALASVFAQKHFGLSGDVAFVLGLLQDVGIAALGATFEDRYARLVSRARSCGPAHLDVVEREDLQIEHSEISAALIQQWGFPDDFVRTVRFQHNSKSGGVDTLRFVDSMRLAESVADLCDNRHACRRQHVLHQLASCCNGGLEEGLRGLEESASLASEITKQFRTPFPDEASLRGVFRELQNPAASPSN